MNDKFVVASAMALACAFAITLTEAEARSADYQFELVGKPQLSDGKDVVRLRLVHLPDRKPVPDAVVFESKADMGPAGMATMGAPVTAMAAKDGVYSFAVDPGMAGTWALHLRAKVQGEPETVSQTIDAPLVK